MNLRIRSRTKNERQKRKVKRIPFECAGQWANERCGRSIEQSVCVCVSAIKHLIGFFVFKIYMNNFCSYIRCRGGEGKRHRESERERKYILKSTFKKGRMLTKIPNGVNVFVGMNSLNCAWPINKYVCALKHIRWLMCVSVCVRSFVCRDMIRATDYHSVSNDFR